MFLIGVDQSTTDGTIARLAAHLPVGMAMGKIMAATSHGILTDDGGIWSIERATDSACRMLQIDSTLWEKAVWHFGEEIERRLIHDRAGEPDADELA